MYLSPVRCLPGLSQAAPPSPLRDRRMAAPRASAVLRAEVRSLGPAVVQSVVAAGALWAAAAARQRRVPGQAEQRAAAPVALTTVAPQWPARATPATLAQQPPVPPARPARPASPSS